VANSDMKPERIVIRAYGLEPHYLRDLPLHHSQKEIKRTNEFTDFELRLKPTNDFKTHLLSLNSWIRIIEPAWLADEMKEWLKEALNRYEEKNE
jgi:hypothetical protein